MSTYVVTGASSGIGAAVAARLTTGGHEVLGIDLAGATIAADLSDPTGRDKAIQAVLEQAPIVEGVITCAGIAGLPGRDGGRLLAINYFGSVAIIDGLAEALGSARSPAVVAIASNSVSTVPLVDEETVAACLAGDESAAVDRGREIGAIAAYPTSKAAICRWVRRHAVSPAWLDRGVRINAVAPGVTETAMVAETRSDPIIGEHFESFPIPTGAPADPDEIAAAVCFLVGQDARFICGSVVFADGGTDALLNPDSY